jgi:hypothetical protein
MTLTTPVPWIGLAAIALMFLLPWLDSRGLFEWPRAIWRRLHRHVCADCGASWTRGHDCPRWLEAAASEPVVPVGRGRGSVRGHLTRLDRPTPPARRRSS